MKNLLTFTALAFFLTIKAQTTNVDVLISKLDNSQLYGTCHYNWVLEMKSESADSLIKIGKPVSGKLIQLLDNQKKGIIAHYILSKIWYNDFQFDCGFKNIDEKTFIRKQETLEKNGIIEYCYNGLNFYERYGKMIADKKILTKNKKMWIEKIVK